MNDRYYRCKCGWKSKPFGTYQYIDTSLLHKTHEDLTLHLAQHHSLIPEAKDLGEVLFGSNGFFKVITED